MGTPQVASRAVLNPAMMQTTNSSGQGKLADVPAEIDRWNWGAFLLNWVWGIGNNTFIALLMFVPFVNFVMPFVLAAKGSAWAWRNKRWESVEHFQSVQRKWAKWGVLALVLSVCLGVVMYFLVGTMLRESEPYRTATQELSQDQAVREAFGEPLVTGTPSGTIQTSGPDGAARFEFSVEGPSGKGTAYLEAKKTLGKWETSRMAVDKEGSDRRISVK